MSVLLIVIPTEYATKSPSIKVNMGTQRPGPTPTPTEGPVLVETKLSMCLYHFLNSNVYNENWCHSIFGRIHVKSVKTISFSHNPCCVHCHKLHSFLTVVQVFTYSDTFCPVGSSQPVIVAVGVVLALLMCGSCLLAGVWWKRRYFVCLTEFIYFISKVCTRLLIIHGVVYYSSTSTLGHWQRYWCWWRLCNSS